MDPNMAMVDKCFDLLEKMRNSLLVRSVLEQPQFSLALYSWGGERRGEGGAAQWRFLGGGVAAAAAVSSAGLAVFFCFSF